MDNEEIEKRIQALVEQEHELRAQLQDSELAPEEKRAQLAALETSLDQCWDLLRRRRARLDAGQNPDDASVRPASEVEDYLQ
ncbi:DUF2630 family protein [Rhodococcus oxybenzonivorans]|uniref:DUF2630 family protein n=1 Tax=Rhodococcus TaxID=1827 RepID=UPI00131F764C|nr:MULTISPECIES: DUF2630 family protein [Rhodococcus]MDV7354126.1 DUF2630 family protein [Rhodococcus oxybenzonivorans]QHE71288.1 hypothetical protein GFS60_04891 [Rhodococcus sp. WAY2]